MNLRVQLVLTIGLSVVGTLLVYFIEQVQETSIVLGLSLTAVTFFVAIAVVNYQHPIRYMLQSAGQWRLRRLLASK